MINGQCKRLSRALFLNLELVLMQPLSKFSFYRLDSILLLSLSVFLWLLRAESIHMFISEPALSYRSRVIFRH